MRCRARGDTQRRESGVLSGGIGERVPPSPLPLPSPFLEKEESLFVVPEATVLDVNPRKIVPATKIRARVYRAEDGLVTKRRSLIRVGMTPVFPELICRFS